MINILEKLVWVLTILSIVFVAALILSKSDISEDEVYDRTLAANAESGGMPWVMPEDAAVYMTAPPPSAQPTGNGQEGQPGERVAAQPAAAQPRSQPKAYYDENNRQMPAYLTQGHWEGNMFVVPEVKIDRSFQEKYSHKRDVVELLNTAYATYEELPGGTIEVTMEKMNRTSPFRRLLGFQEGDRIVAINGQSIGGITGAWDMYEGMKSLPNFQVEVLRDGQRVQFNYGISE